MSRDITPLSDLERIVNKIPSTYADDYSDWLNIGIALHNSNLDSLYIWEAFSKLSDKYEENVCKSKWETFNSDIDNPRTLKSLISIQDESTNNNLDYSDGLKAQGHSFLDTVFGDINDNEYICISPDCITQKYYQKKDVDTISDIIGGDNDKGFFICCNPLKENRRKQDKVSRFKHLLIEFDNIDVNEQKKLLAQKDFLPIKTAVFSGNKSVHFLIAIDAKNKTEYNSRVSYIFDYLKEHKLFPDEQCKDPVRYTRLAGVKRNGVLQELLYVNPNASFDDWKRNLEKEKIDITNIHYITLSDALAYDENNAYNDGSVLLGEKYLYKGGALLINAFSGVGKSTLALQLSMEMSCGKHLLGGIPVHKPLKVCLFQAENDADEINQNMKYIYLNGKNNGDFSEADAKLINKNLLTLGEKDCGRGEEFLAKLEYIIETKKPDLIVLDPVFHFYNGKISDQSEVSNFFRGGLHRILSQTKTASIIIHHRNKPSKDENALPFDACNYVGSGSSDLTNWVRAIINLNRFKDDDSIFYLQLCKRGEKAGNGGKRKIFIKKSNNPNQPYWYEIDPPETEQNKKGVHSKYDNKGYEFLEPISSSDFEKLVCGLENCTHQQYRNHVRAAVTANRVYFDPILKKYIGIKYQEGQSAIDRYDILEVSKQGDICTV